MKDPLRGYRKMLNRLYEIKARVWGLCPLQIRTEGLNSVLTPCPTKDQQSLLAQLDAAIDLIKAEMAKHAETP